MKNVFQLIFRISILTSVASVTSSSLELIQIIGGKESGPSSSGNSYKYFFRKMTNFNSETSQIIFMLSCKLAYLFQASKTGGCQAISLLATSDYTRRICDNDSGWVVFKEQSWDFYRPLFPHVKSNKLTAHIKRI